MESFLIISGLSLIFIAIFEKIQDLVIKRLTGHEKYVFYARVDDGVVEIKAINKNAKNLANSDDLENALIKSKGE